MKYKEKQPIPQDNSEYTADLILHLLRLLRLGLGRGIGELLEGFLELLGFFGQEVDILLDVPDGIVHVVRLVA